MRHLIGALQFELPSDWSRHSSLIKVKSSQTVDTFWIHIVSQVLIKSQLLDMVPHTASCLTVTHAQNVGNYILDLLGFQVFLGEHTPKPLRKRGLMAPETKFSYRYQFERSTF